MTGAELIAAERDRQINHKGFDAESDDQHWRGEMVDAAICYATIPGTEFREATLQMIWPWSWADWKPWCKDRTLFTVTNRIHDLKKAGALLAAEIDRLQRMNDVIDEKLAADMQLGDAS